MNEKSGKIRNSLWIIMNSLLRCNRIQTDLEKPEKPGKKGFFQESQENLGKNFLWAKLGKKFYSL